MISDISDPNTDVEAIYKDFRKWLCNRGTNSQFSTDALVDFICYKIDKSNISITREIRHLALDKAGMLIKIWIRLGWIRVFRGLSFGIIKGRGTRCE